MTGFVCKEHGIVNAYPCPKCIHQTFAAIDEHNSTNPPGMTCKRCELLRNVDSLDAISYAIRSLKGEGSFTLTQDGIAAERLKKILSKLLG